MGGASASSTTASRGGGVAPRRCGGTHRSRRWHRRCAAIALSQTPKSLPPKWFYDSVGSDLFDQITRLPEYYPTRAEAQILRARSAEIAVAREADTLVELGSGTSEKTRLLLDALRESGPLRRFIPF